MLRREGVSTSLAVLPVFAGGGRGCWVDLSANDLLTPEAVQLALPPTRSSATTPNRSPLPDPNSTPRQVLAQLSTPAAQPSLKAVRALHVGYPHLLTQLRGSGLADVLAVGSALLSTAAGVPPLTSVDVNGATLEAAEAGAAAPAPMAVAPKFGSPLEPVPFTTRSRTAPRGATDGSPARQGTTPRWSSVRWKVSSLPC